MSLNAILSNVAFGTPTFCTTAYTVSNSLALQHERIHVYNQRVFTVYLLV